MSSVNCDIIFLWLQSCSHMTFTVKVIVHNLSMLPPGSFEPKMADYKSYTPGVPHTSQASGVKMMVNANRQSSSAITKTSLVGDVQKSKNALTAPQCLYMIFRNSSNKCLTNSCLYIKRLDSRKYFTIRKN